MTNTAKDTNTAGAAQLSWTRKKEWGSEGATHRAEADGWRYCVDSPKKGQWVLRGWGPDDEFLYRDGRTVKDMKKLAGDHLDEYRTKMAQAAAALVAMSVLAAKVSDGMNRLSGFMQGIQRSARRALAPVPQSCGCPTPVHRMNCGGGATPTVTRRAGAVVLLDEGAALLGSLDPDDIPDDQCLDRDGNEYPGHDYDEVDCRRCGAEPDLLSD